MRHRVLFATVFLFLLFGCKKDKNPVDPNTIVTFNLSLGKTWMYAWKRVLTDSAGALLYIETDTVQVRIASVHDSLSNYKELIRFEAQSIPHFIGLTSVWYQFGGDSLVEIAYRNPGSTHTVLPKRTALAVGRSIIGPPMFSLLPRSVIALMKLKGLQDTTMFREDVRIVYKFPLVNGKIWTSFTNPFLQVREVVGSESINRAGENFSCAKIKTTLPTLDPELEWYDFVSYDGLIEREIKITLEVTNSSGPEVTGEKKYSQETLTLISS